MDAIPHPSRSLAQEMETDSRSVSLEVVSNHSLLKGKECLTDFNEKLSQCLFWGHEIFQPLQ